MIRLINILFVLSLYIPVEAQIGLEFTLKGGVRTSGNQKYLPYEGSGVSDVTWYTYGGSVYIPKFKIAAEWTRRETGRYAFIKVPDFLISKPKIKRPSLNRLAEAGDTISTYIEFYPHWYSLSYNTFPSKWEKHQFLFGAGYVKRRGGLLKIDYVIDHPWGREGFLKLDPNVSQSSILWKSEYIFKPSKYTLLSARFNYAYFSKFPHSYYEFILSLGTYINI